MKRKFPYFLNLFHVVIASVKTACEIVTSHINITKLKTHQEQKNKWIKKTLGSWDETHEKKYSFLYSSVIKQK